MFAGERPQRSELRARKELMRARSAFSEAARLTGRAARTLRVIAAFARRRPPSAADSSQIFLGSFSAGFFAEAQRTSFQVSFQLALRASAQLPPAFSALRCPPDFLQADVG